MNIFRKKNKIIEQKYKRSITKIIIILYLFFLIVWAVWGEYYYMTDSNNIIDKKRIYKIFHH